MEQENEAMPWDEAKLAASSHAELYNLRRGIKSKEGQNVVSAYEHRAFAREAVADNPAMAVSLAVAIPGYQASKALGLEKSRSDPSLRQATEAFKGVGEGLALSVQKPWEEAQTAARKLYESVKDTTKKATSKFPWEEAKQKTVTEELPMPDVEVPKGFNMDNYLKKLAMAESSGNPNAKASTSSATGLYQFIDGTWEQTVKAIGKNYTLEDRTNPKKAKEVAIAFTQKNLNKAMSDLGRVPSEAEAYMYHFLGNAKKILTAPKTDPAYAHVSAAQARANKNVFYTKDNKPKTVGEVLAMFERKFD